MNEETVSSTLTGGSVSDATALLVECIDLDKKKKTAKKVLEEINDSLKNIKAKLMDVFIDMGVQSMKAGKTVYLTKQIWAGTSDSATNFQVTEALKDLDLSNHVTYNHQSLSAYVREIAKSHPEWLNAEGEITAEPEEIVAALPEPLNRLLKVSEVMDIKIRS